MTMTIELSGGFRFVLGRGDKGLQFLYIQLCTYSRNSFNAL